MAVNEKEMTLDLEMMKRAAENFKKASASRERKTELLKQKRYTEVESKERLTTRANRLLSQVKEFYTVEAIPPKMRDLVKKEHITESEISDMLFERIIGATKDFLSAAFLERGVRVTRSVGRVVIRVDGNIAGYGTGFLVTPHLMMTNWHVFNSREMAEESLIEFNYQYGISGTPLQVETFRLDPAAFFMNNKDLDFAIVAVKQTSELGTPVKKMGFCPLIAAHGKISVGEFVNIIQHPRGEMKQVIVRENKLLDIPDSPGTVAHYEGDTEQGSSGSPVFNDDWEVVALHHTGVPKTDSQGNLLDKDGNIWQEGDDPARLEWIANEGIRISSICEFITRKDVKEHEKELKDELVEMSKYELSPWQIPEVINATETLIPEKKRKNYEAIINSADVQAGCRFRRNAFRNS